MATADDIEAAYSSSQGSLLRYQARQQNPRVEFFLTWSVVSICCEYVDVKLYE